MTSAVFGNIAASLTFMSMYNVATKYFYNHNGRTKKWDFRAKNYLIYLASDASSCFVRIFFEVRKQMIQMCHEPTLNECGHRLVRSIVPSLFRDLIFRSLTLGGFYLLTPIEQETELKMPVEHI